MRQADPARLGTAELAALIRPDERTIPVTVLTGFLGAGKTTLLRRLLARPDMAATAIVINEFGEIGLDHHLIESAREDTLVLSNGCLCCALQGDLVRCLRGLLDRATRGEVPAFDRLVIETSGLVDPAPVLQSLMSDPLRLSRYRFHRLVTVVDAALGALTLARYPEARRQAALADRLLLSKTDLAAPAATTALRARLRAINPTAEQGLIRDAAASDAVFATGPSGLSRLPELDRPTRHGDGHGGGHGEGLSSLVLTAGAAVDWPHFAAGLEALIAARGEDLLRIKGLVEAAGCTGPIVLHGVQHVFHAPDALAAWPPGPRRTRLVVILRDRSHGVIVQALEQLGLTPAPAADAAGQKAQRGSDPTAGPARR